MLRRAFPLVLCVCACGGEVRDADDYTDHDLGVLTSGLNAGQVGGCDTSAVLGLTQQLIAELNCIMPNTMTSFTGAGISVNSGVNAFLAPAATNGLKAAVAQQGGTIGISSAYRSVAQQYLLYKWWQAGQCGIQAAAVPGSSNHQSGRAIDVPSYSSWITALQAHGWKWFGSGDTVHFDFNGAANLGATSVLAFQRLWNKNNANKLAEDGAWGPASSSAMASSPTTGFAVSGCAMPPPPPPATDGTLKGRVYQVNPADAADLSQGIGGATVKVAGQTLTTDATGLYTATLAAGTVTIAVTATGFGPASLSRAVLGGQTVWGSIGLSPVGVPDTVKPDVALTNPAEGASVDVAALTVTGTASDDRGTLSALTIALNGAAPQPLTPGPISVAVKLAAGPNTIAVEAVDPAGNKTRLERKVTFHAGVAGTVTDDARLMPLADVEVRLLAANDTVVASTKTAADGTYGFDVAPGPLTVVATRAGFAEYRMALEVSDDARTTWSFSLTAGEPGTGVRFIYPREGEPVLGPVVVVSGAVDGFTPALVRVNGARADLVAGNTFTVRVPVELGQNVLEAVAAKADGTVFVARVQVTRLDPAAHEEATRVRGGCSAAPGPWAAGLILLALARTMRRRADHAARDPLFPR